MSDHVQTSNLYLKQCGNLLDSAQSADERETLRKRLKNKIRLEKRKSAIAFLRNGDCRKALEIDQLKETVAIDSRERVEFAKVLREKESSLAAVTKRLAVATARISQLELENCELKAKVTRLSKL